MAAQTRTIGKFELLDQVGVGAFGTVWKARDTELGRTVAVKMLHPSLVQAKTDRERFFREARASAQLRHPGIVMIHEVAELEGMPTIVSDFVEGVTLRELMDTRRLTFREAAEVMAQVAEALDYAHSFKVVHRDIKPANVMIEFGLGVGLGASLDRAESASTTSVLSNSSTPVSSSSAYSSRTSGPRALVLDFGLALRDEVEVTMTTDGQIIGTPAYMSPEQAAGQSHQVDRRSDIYSIGVVLYELLTGEVPFRGSKIMLVHQVLHEEPRAPRRINHAIPHDMETICLKAMLKLPAHRYSTSRELANDLRRFLSGEPILARPITSMERVWRWCRRNRLVATLFASVATLLTAVAIVSIVAAVNLRRAAHVSEDLRVKAEDSRQEALDRAAESRDLLLQQYAANGVQLMSEGDAFSALLWFVETLRQDNTDQDRQFVHRVRAATILRSCPKLVDVFFHEQAVFAARFSPDGRRVATASNDRTARIWDVATGASIGRPMRHGAKVGDVRFSADGRWVVTASDDHTARVWDAATGEPVASALDHGDTVISAMFSPDGSHVVTASRDHTVRVWLAATGECVAGPFEHKDVVQHAAFSPDGRRVVSASGDGTARVWDLANGQPALPPLVHGAQVNCAWFNPDGSRLITACNDSTVVFWNASSGEKVRVVTHDEQVRSAGISNDGTRVFTICGDSVRILDGLTGEMVCPPLKHRQTVHSAEFRGDGRRILTTSEDGKVRVWDPETGRRLEVPLSHSYLAYHASFSPDGRQIVSASQDGTTRVWDLATTEGAFPTISHRDLLRSASFSPDGRRVIVAGVKSARICDATTGQPQTPLLQHDYEIHMASFSPDGRLALCATGQETEGSTAGATYLWNAATGDLFRSPQRHEAAVSSAVFSPDGRRYITGCWDGTARIWDTITGSAVTRPFQHKRVVYYAAFNGDGRRVVTAGFDGVARVWDAATGEAITPLMSHEEPHSFFHATFNHDGSKLLTSASSEPTGIARTQVWDLPSGQPTPVGIRHSGPYALYSSFSPDSRRFVAAAGGAAQIYETETGNRVGLPMEHTGMVCVASFSPDGNLVLTASWDRTARLWDAHTGTPVSLPFEHRQEIRHAEFSLDGRRVVTASDDTTARIWNVEPDARPVDDLAGLAQLLSGRRVGTTGALEVLNLDEQRSLWTNQRGRFPAEFTVTVEELLAWRQRDGAAMARSPARSP
jgi:WD40 repeat protein/serine/threonine protein kinase